jgi:hypothetical protein
MRREEEVTSKGGTASSDGAALEGRDCRIHRPALPRRSMLEHFAARFLALAAFLGALLHVCVFGEFLALLTASGTRLGAGGANEVGERTLTGRDASGGRAVRGTILTRLKCLQVFLLALSQHVPTVVRARVAGARAFAARLGTLVKGLSMMIGTARFVIRGEAGVQRHRHRETEDRDTKGSHRRIPPGSEKLVLLGCTSCSTLRNPQEMLSVSLQSKNPFFQWTIIQNRACSACHLLQIIGEEMSQ